MKNLQLLSQVFYSNSMAVVEQHHFFFDNLWDKSISANNKIDEFKKGIVPEIMEVIKNPAEIQRIYLYVLNLSISKIMLILTTSSAFVKYENIKLLQLLEKASDKNIKVRIIILGSNIIDC